MKVLDFGLAKAFAGDEADVNLSHSPTLSAQATRQGVILGTAAYMSPEQAKGLPVDRRSDLFSFGCVLFEMLTGRQAFPGKLATEILASIIAREPDYSTLQTNLHPRLNELLRRCFEKEPKDRWQAVGDLRVELERVLEDPEGRRVQSLAAASPRVTVRALAPWFAATAIVAAVGGWLLKPSPPTQPRRVSRFEHHLPADQRFVYLGRRLVTVSPDGTQFVYVANGQLYLRSMDGVEARPIQGTNSPVTSPVFSPDGQWLAYWSRPDAQLKKIAAGGGAAVTLCDAPHPFGMSWAPDDTILYGLPGGVMRVSANGGIPEVLVEIEDGEVHGPQLLPGGRSLLFTTSRGAGPSRWDEAEIVVQRLGSGARKVLWTGGSDARYVPTGHLVYALGDVLFAVPFDLQNLELTGGPIPVVEGMQLANRTASANYDFSANGSLVHVPHFAGTTPDRILALVDRTGVATPLNATPAEYLSPRLSPNGQLLAVQTVADGGDVIWVYDLSDDKAIRQLTFEGDNRRPVWTPDSERITFASDRDGTMSLYWQPADGSGVAERLTTAEEETRHWPSSWSPDGKVFAFMVESGADWDIWTLSRDAEAEPQRLYDTPEMVYLGPEFSPDGKWLVFGFGPHPGGQDIYVEPFPPTGARRRISQDGGTWPMWSPDGSELFYRRVVGGMETTLKSVDVITEPDFSFRNEQTLPPRDFVVVSFYRDYDIAPDGERFVMIFPAPGEESTESPQRIRIVLNWFEELKARVPVSN